MTADLIERLRKRQQQKDDLLTNPKWIATRRMVANVTAERDDWRDAADELDRLRAALEAIESATFVSGDPHTVKAGLEEARRIAREALSDAD